MHKIYLKISVYTVGGPIESEIPVEIDEKSKDPLETQLYNFTTKVKDYIMAAMTDYILDPKEADCLLDVGTMIVPIENILGVKYTLITKEEDEEEEINPEDIVTIEMEED